MKRQTLIQNENVFLICFQFLHTKKKRKPCNARVNHPVIIFNFYKIIDVVRSFFALKALYSILEPCNNGFIYATVKIWHISWQFLGRQSVLTISSSSFHPYPTSWFLYSLSLTSWSIPNIEFKLLWPILVPNFFRNHQKRTIFGMFPFYHVTSNSHISAIFCKYGMKFFGEPLEMLYQKNRIK